jgi:putative endonuclease
LGCGGRRFESCHPDKKEASVNTGAFLLQMERYFVYILYSEKLGQYYTGFTMDVKQRLLDHNSGLSVHTSKGRPWTLILAEEISDKKTALQLENKIKKRGAKRYLQDKGLL